MKRWAILAAALASFLLPGVARANTYDAYMAFLGAANYWPLSANGNDTIGGHNAATTGTIAFGSPIVANVSGITVGNSSSYLSVTQAFTNATGFAVALWIKTSSTTTANALDPLWTSPYNYIAFAITAGGCASGHMAFSYVGTNSVGHYACTLASQADDIGHLLVANCNGTSCDLSVDGFVQATLPYTLSSYAAIAYYFGNYASGGSPWLGALGGIAYFPAALAPWQVYAIYSCGTVGFCPATAPPQKPKTVVFTFSDGTHYQWPVPTDWNDANNSIVAKAGGGVGSFTDGGGVGRANGGGGGGGGAKAVSTNVTLTPGSTLDYHVAPAATLGDGQDHSTYVCTQSSHCNPDDANFDQALGVYAPAGYSAGGGGGNTEVPGNGGGNPPTGSCPADGIGNCGYGGTVAPGGIGQVPPGSGSAPPPYLNGGNGGVGAGGGNGGSGGLGSPLVCGTGGDGASPGGGGGGAGNCYYPLGGSTNWGGGAGGEIDITYTPVGGNNASAGRLIMGD